MNFYPDYRSLAVSILHQAVQDFLAIKETIYSPRQVSLEKELLTFFSSDWFYSLCDYLDITPNNLLKRLNL